MRLETKWKTVSAGRNSILRASAMLLGIGWIVAVRASIFVTYDGPPTAQTCTLAQAINAANAANGIDPASYGSQTTPLTGNCAGATSDSSNAILLEISTITLTTVDNYWYGPNALPPIASTITVVGDARVTTIRAVHTDDPTPATGNAFRLFYVSGGLELPVNDLSPPSLTIINAVLQGGYAKGGDSQFGGGGAGMGGAIFNQGSLTLQRVSLIGNTAQGGSIDSSGNYAGAGMGQDGSLLNGGGFGGVLWATYGGAGSSASLIDGGGGGGGGFISGSDGGIAGTAGASGGGKGALGGPGAAGIGGGGGAGGGAGDGGGGGGGDVIDNGSGNGGAFGFGGVGSIAWVGGGGNGGGVGGGGGASQINSGGGGGFGGGGGSSASSHGGAGGFGGGAGQGAGAVASFGGGFDASGAATGGAGIGGAIFNHTGTVILLNVTATNNSARGGTGDLGSGSGSGLGAVLFNLNGTVTIDFSTLAGNSLANSNGTLSGEDGSVYSLAFGNDINAGAATSASLTINNSIVYGTQADAAGFNDDIVVNFVNGAHTNAASLVYSGANIVHSVFHQFGITISGTSPSTTDPLLGSLSLYSPDFSPSEKAPVLPIGSNSPAYNAAPSCLEADGTTTLNGDARFTLRPQFDQCDVGAYEFDGDYIFADGAEVKL